MRLSIEHLTHYRFSGPVPRGLQRLRMTPKATAGQRVIGWQLAIEGGRIEAEYDDHNVNHTTLVSFEDGAHAVTIRCAGEVDTADNHGVTGAHAGCLPLWHFSQPTALTRAGPKVKALIATTGARAGEEPLPLLHRLSAAVLAAIAYAPGHTDVETSAEAALGRGRGVCQDHAHAFIAAARALGMPARYVSGYLLMEGRVAQEAGHAWAEAHVPALGWVGFDVANGISPDARYVRVASGRDYREAAPVTGIRYGTHDETLHVALAIAQRQQAQ